MRKIAILLALSTAVATPALAQSKAELAAQDARLAQRLTVLEQRFLTGDPAAAQLMQRVDALETTVRNLTGEIEQLKFERDSLRSEVQALAGDLRPIQDLATRMQIHLDAVDMVAANAPGPRPPAGALPRETTSGLPPAGMPPFGTITTPEPAPSTGGTLSTIPQPPRTAELTVPTTPDMQALAQLPERGRTKLAEGDFLAAQAAFAQYLQMEPNAPDAGEVSFWLGESHFVRGEYADAADAYIQSMRKDARGPKGPDAMVRLAAALRELGSTAEACQTLNSFPAQYPSAPADVKEKARVERSRTGC